MENRNEFDGMPEIPAEVYEQIDKGFHKYLFFETIKRGHRRYTCTACHKTFEEGKLVLRDIMSSADFGLFHAMHNDEAECPLCGTMATVKNVKVCDVTKFWSSNCVVVFMANGPEDVWMRAIYADRGYCYAKDNDGTLRVKLNGVTSHFESARYHLVPGHYDMWKAWGRDCPLEWCKYAEEPFSWNHGLYVEKYFYHVAYVADLKDTFLRYHGMDYPYLSQQFVRYLCHYAEHPQLEMLSRLGHRFLVDEVVMQNRENTSLLDWSAKKPWDLYRLSKQEYNDWEKYRYDLDVYKLFKRIKGKGKRDWERAYELERCFHGLKNAYKFIATTRRMKVNVREVMNYVGRVQQNSGGGCWHCPGITLHEAYTLWEDYINLAEGLGRGKTISVMPKDLKAAHDVLLGAKQKQDAKQKHLSERKRITNEINEIKRASRRNAKQLRKKAESLASGEKYPTFTRIYQRLAPKYTWGNEQFTICAPSSIADVIYDGLFLSHCVGKEWGAEPGWRRYLNRIRSGESFLLFLRHTKKQDEPYYILEVEPGGTVRQKRTVLDRQDERDKDKVFAFIAEWQAVIASRMTEKDKQQAQKSREIRVEEYAELRRNKVEVRNGFLRGKLLADVLEADLLEVGFAAEETKEIKPREGRKKAV